MATAPCSRKNPTPTRFHPGNEPAPSCWEKNPRKTKVVPREHLNPKSTRVVSRGRKSKLSYLLSEQPELYQRMLEMIRAGSFIKTAALAIGVAPETLSRWLARGKVEERSIYAQFRQQVCQAVALATVDVEARVRDTNPVFWLKCGPRKLLGDGLWRD